MIKGTLRIINGITPDDLKKIFKDIRLIELNRLYSPSNKYMIIKGMSPFFKLIKGKQQNYFATYDRYEEKWKAI